MPHLLRLMVRHVWSLEPWVVSKLVAQCPDDESRELSWQKSTDNDKSIAVANLLGHISKLTRLTSFLKTQDACPPTNDRNCCEQQPTCVSDLKIGSQLTHTADPTHTSTLVTRTCATQTAHSIATFSLIFCLPVQRIGMSICDDMCRYRIRLHKSYISSNMT